MSVLYHAHSPLLFACDRVSRNRPITRTACVLRLRTFIEDSTASSLSACSYQTIHVACLFYTTSHSPFLIACDRASRNRPITRTARVLRLRTFIEDSTAPILSACSYPSIHVACRFYTTSHSSLLIACDRVSRNRPITRTACVFRRCTFIEESIASSLSACYLSSHTGGLSGGVLVAPKLSLLHALMP